MKRLEWVTVVVLAMVCVSMAQGRNFRGTVIRMKMSECTRQHSFVSAMSGVQVMSTQACPEYTVMTDKVVYVLVGRKPEEFIPLAEDVVFHVRRNDVVVISEDEKDESHFAVRQMMLRDDWDRNEQHREVMTRIAERSTGYDTRSPNRAAVMSTSTH